MKRLVQGALRSAGYQVSKIPEPLIHTPQIDVFGFCFERLLAKTPNPFVVQVGANDGVASDPIRPFILKHKLRALLIEPLPAVFELLSKNYAGVDTVTLCNAAISARSGEVTLYTPNKTIMHVKPHTSGLSSFSREQVIKELRRENVWAGASSIESVTVSTKTAADLLSDYSIQTVDVLQIDTEGYDWEVLKQFDLRGFKTSLVNMEFFHLAPACCLSRGQR